VVHEARWWCKVPTFTYPEGGSHALQVCQHHHQVVQVGHFVRLSETQGTRCSRLARLFRPIFAAETFSTVHTAHGVTQRTERAMVP
jgi:hypothetical protein